MNRLRHNQDQMSEQEINFSIAQFARRLKFDIVVGSDKPNVQLGTHQTPDALDNRMYHSTQSRKIVATEVVKQNSERS